MNRPPGRAVAVGEVGSGAVGVGIAPQGGDGTRDSLEKFCRGLVAGACAGGDIASGDKHLIRLGLRVGWAPGFRSGPCGRVLVREAERSDLPPRIGFLTDSDLVVPLGQRECYLPAAGRVHCRMPVTLVR